MPTKTLAQGNGPQIREMLATEHGHADLYRTAAAGPSGQRAQLLVGRVRFVPADSRWGDYEFEIIQMTGHNAGDRVGFARREFGHDGWALTEQTYDGDLRFRGRASTLSVGVDVLINGKHAALGRHDSQRISGGWFRPVNHG